MSEWSCGAIGWAQSSRDSGDLLGPLVPLGLASVFSVRGVLVFLPRADGVLDHWFVAPREGAI